MGKLARFLLALLILAAPAVASAKPLELKWDDLIPPGVPEFNEEGLISNLDAPSGIGYDPSYFPLNEELGGKQVRIPGYVVPLNFEEAAVDEFFLVPYLGACIHVPPPPPNQIVFVKSPKRIQVEELFMAVWVTGRMAMESKESEIGLAGYSLAAETIEPYEE